MLVKIPQPHPQGKYLPPGKLLTKREAAWYLGVSVRWLEGNPDIPRVNLARPGRRAMWRYRVADLDRFAKESLSDPEGRR